MTYNAVIIIPLVWEHFVFNTAFRSKKVFLVMSYVLQITPKFKSIKQQFITSYHYMD